MLVTTYIKAETEQTKSKHYPCLIWEVRKGDALMIFLFAKSAPHVIFLTHEHHCHPGRITASFARRRYEEDANQGRGVDCQIDRPLRHGGHG